VTWSRLDDTCTDHPKVLALSDKAFRLWVCSIVYCSRHLTDGRLDEAAIALLGAHARAEGSEQLAGPVEELVAARLWDRSGDGECRVHDYLDYNPPRAKVLADREKRARAGRKGGRKSGQRRRQRKPPGEASAEGNAQAGASGVSEGNAQACAQGHSEPRPSPSTKERGGASPAPSGADSALPVPAGEVPEELAGLSEEELRTHQERTRRRIADLLGDGPTRDEGGG
jgi:hypothetical protein